MSRQRINDRPTPCSLSRIVAGLLLCWLGLLACSRTAQAQPPNDEHRPPNIVFILADDLGYGDLGCYGQEQIRTPRLDALAAAGLRFTDAYAGCTVCAPSRCALLTGLHTGRARIRGNATVPLEDADVTVAEILRSAGYETALIGKWGLGETESTGLPTLQGFAEFYGYLNQQHAHNHFPDFLWRNTQRETLRNIVERGVAVERHEYSHDLLTAAALEFLARERTRPFFLLFTPIIPHANNEAGPLGMEVPDDAPYGDEPWPAAQKNKAAMISRLDESVGRLLDCLAERGLAEETLVCFTSDNGPHKEGGADPAFFRSAGPLRGIKRDLYEGGIRVPLLASWPGAIEPGVADFPCALWDLLPTAAELAGLKPPPNLDGVSLVPLLLGAAHAGRAQGERPPLYWEFHERGFTQALRAGPYKLVRAWERPAELYDLSSDLAEEHDLAAREPQVVERLTALLDAARVPSPHWPCPADAPQPD